MSKGLEEWVKSDVKSISDRPLKWLSEQYFFRDPSRPVYSDTDYMFSPADGIILYQKRVEPDECIVDIKGKNYSLRDAMRNPSFNKSCLVIGIFMTMYDAHINRVPYAGYLSYKHLEPIGTFNHPMLEVERGLVNDLSFARAEAGYLHSNQRVINRVYVPRLGSHYYILQVADYDVDCITPFSHKQNTPVAQNQRFSQIRFGSQVDLIVPLSERYELETLEDNETHVSAGLDPLIRVRRITMKPPHFNTSQFKPGRNSNG